MSIHDQLPPELGKQFLSFLREVNGEFELVDKEGLVKFVAEHGKAYPVLLTLFKIDYEAAIEHFKKTGEVLPGMKIIHTSTPEGSNVTKLEVFRGPTALEWQNKGGGRWARKGMKKLAGAVPGMFSALLKDYTDIGRFAIGRTKK